MQRLFAVLVVLAVLLVLCWRLTRGQEDQIGPRPIPRAEGAESGAIALAESGPGSRSERALALASAPPTSQGDTPGGDGPRAHVFGRIVDAQGRPLAGARVRFHARQGSWSSREQEGGRTHSAADGRFSLDLPVPTTRHAVLEIVPPPLHRRVELELGGAFPDRDGLVAGDNDFGDVPVAAGAAITGLVVDETGAPIARAWVHAEILQPESSSYPVETDVVGVFELENLLPGERRLSAWAAGFAPRRDLLVTAAAGTSKQLDPIVLQRGPTLSGIALDPSGAPVGKLHVRARAVSGSASASATTAADGTFVVTLGVAAAHTLSIVASDAWAGLLDPTAERLEHAPGASGIRLVVRPADRITFQVQSAVDGAAIERFGIEIQRKRDSDERARDELRIESHPGGLVRLPCAPGAARVTVDAPRHAPLETDVSVGEGPGAALTLRLDPEGVLTGRVGLGAGFATDATVTLHRETLSKKDGAAWGLPGWSSSETSSDLFGYAARSRTCFVDASGAFRFDRLATGTYLLEIAHRDAKTELVREIHVRAGAARDLGEIHLDPGGVVRGRLLVPPEESALGYVVLLEPDWVDPVVSLPGRVRRVVVRASDGRFECRSLEAGTYLVHWERPRSEAGFVLGTPAPDTPRIEVRSGVTSEIVLDATRSAPCTLAVRVWQGDRPWAGVHVRPAIERPSRPGIWSSAESWIGNTPDRTDADGRVEGQVEGGVRVQISLYEAGGRMPLWTDERDFEAPARGRIEREIRVRVGQLALELPSSLTPPPEGDIRVSLTAANGSRRMISIPTARGRPPSPGERLWYERHIDLGSVLAGSYAVEIGFRRFDPVPSNPGRKESSAARPPFSGRIDVIEDQTARIVVPSSP